MNQPAAASGNAPDQSGAHELRRHARVRRLALARLRVLENGGAEGGALRAFHARYKYLLMACDTRRTRTLGQLAAAAPRRAAAEPVAAYRRELSAALVSPPTRGGHVNALLHMFGYVSGSLTAAERSDFLELVERYRRGEAALDAPAGMLREWIVRQDVAYLKDQHYFESLLRNRGSEVRRRRS